MFVAPIPEQLPIALHAPWYERFLLASEGASILRLRKTANYVAVFGTCVLKPA
jgi:hypothetical protein